MPDVTRFLTCGSVDDGKSTMIGKLLFDAGLIYEDQVLSLKMELERSGKSIDKIDYSYLLDGLISEREQGITIDVAYRYFSINNKKYIVADTPGHSQYTKNMATGASHCDAAIILIDARKGLGVQTRRHTLICALMGINNILFAINKFDLAQWTEAIFNTVQSECEILINDLSQIGLTNIIYQCIPISALLGDNLLFKSDNMLWYNDKTIYEWLDNLEPTRTPNAADVRFVVQYIINSDYHNNIFQSHADHSFTSHELNNFRAYSGKLISGHIVSGQKVKILTSELPATVKGIIKGFQFVNSADEGDSISLIFEDDIDFSRGDIMVSDELSVTKHSDLAATVIWMDKKPLLNDETYIMKGYYGYVNMTIAHIDFKYNLESFQQVPAIQLDINEVGIVKIHSHQSLFFDTYACNKQLGSFIIIDRVTNETVGCGLINEVFDSEDTQSSYVITKKRNQFVLWFTGLSGSGKTTLSERLKPILLTRGYTSVLLDGDILRRGISKDLGFADKDRSENIRRTAQIAKLILHSDVNVMCSLISPFQKDRQTARIILSDFHFIEIFLDASVEICERRDSKGYYKKARVGEISDFTGIDSTYEKPLNPDITINTGVISIEESVNIILDYLAKKEFISR